MSFRIPAARTLPLALALALAAAALLAPQAPAAPAVPSPDPSSASCPARTASSPTGPRWSPTSTARRGLRPRAGRGGRADHRGPAVPGGDDHLRGEHGAAGGDPPRQPAPRRPARPRRRRGGAAHRDRARRSWREPRHPLDRGGRRRRPRWRRRTGWPRATTRRCARCSTHVVCDDPVAQPGRHAAGHRVVPAALGKPWEGSDSAVPLPALHRPRQQPRLVHVHAGGEPAHRCARSTTAGARRSSTTCTRWAARGARLFVPPYVDPWEPNVDPALIAAVNALGAHVAARLTDRGPHRASSSTPSTTRGRPRAPIRTATAAVRILTETASARMATPIEVQSEELEPGIGYDPRRALLELPGPLAGRDLAPARHRGHQLRATRAMLEHAAQNREHWLRTSSTR